ncbi:MAG TPA: hybrid sensor histidine kinase/response regulator [Verrucomicrobiales bacterium]|nr:hybrid sensor histidine kinase/response regulator [Verrucomicrobiales bacterium]
MKDPDARRQTLLVIDDQEENLRILGAILTKMGYDLVPASDGNQALQRLSVRQPDLILLDIGLPDIDGVTLCRKIKENPDWADIPIIFVSASVDKDTVVKALETGGVDYVTKPYNRSELISRVRAHLSLKESRDAIEALAADKDALLGMLAHDLKNHVSGVLMGARLLLERNGSLPERSVRLIKEIEESSQRMLAFIQRLLTNQEPAQTRLVAAAFDAGGIVQELVRHHRDAAAVKQVEVVYEPANEELWALGDANAFRQVVDNLISNAVKFGPRGGRVDVALSSEDEDERVVVEVTDTGPGFSEEDRTRLFQRYAKLSARPTGGEPSSGLGLHIAKRLMTRMHGSLALVSPPGQGARFRAELPVAQPEDPS